MDVAGLVIGGGIAGLTAAVALRQRGVAVRVCEAAPQILPLGTGIWMAPNAMQVFHRLGLADQINAVRVPLRIIQVVDGQMRPLLCTNQARVRQQFGFGTTAIRRARLQGLLLAALAPADVLLGKAFASLREEEDGVTVAFADGSRFRTSFVVAADGIHSPVRAQLFPGVRLVGSGHVVWRGMAELAPTYKQTITEAWAAGLRFGCSEVADGLVDWFTVLPARSADWNSEGTPTLQQRLQQAFPDFTCPVLAILAATEAGRIIRSEVADFDPLPQWSRGRVCLIGDAAHAATPYLGQGGCQAVEDAYALAQCLHRAATPEEAFATFQQLRRPKAAHIVRLSHLMGYLEQFRSWRTGLASAL